MDGSYWVAARSVVVLIAEDVTAGWASLPRRPAAVPAATRVHGVTIYAKIRLRVGRAVHPTHRWANG